MIEQKITLDTGSEKIKAVIQQFEDSDREILLDIYYQWRELCDKIKSFNNYSRAVNIPETLSEGSFCLEMKMYNVVKKNKGNFDCFNPKTNQTVQIKASATNTKAPTSFGPRSTWDEFYFLDFYRNGKWDGKFDIYSIKTEEVINQKVSKAQNFLDQQNENRRPRYNIGSKILKKGIKPVKTGNLVG